MTSDTFETVSAEISAPVTEISEPPTPDTLVVKKRRTYFTWIKDPKMTGLRLYKPTGYYYLNQRVGDIVLNERTPFKENQKTLAKHYRDKRVAEERQRQKDLGIVGIKRGGFAELLTFWNEVMYIWTHRLHNDPSITPATIKVREFRLRSIIKTWQSLYGTDLKREKILETTEDMLIGWHGFFAKQHSADYANKARSVWIQLYDIALTRSTCVRNAGKLLPKIPVTQKTLVLPSRDELRLLLDNIRNQRCNAHAKDIIDFIEGIVYTGLRLSEAKALTTDYVKFSADGKLGWLSLPKEIVKNKQRARVVPLQPAAFPLFRRLIAEADPQTKAIFKVNECTKTLTRACEECGLYPLTHHSLRHLFATFAYEATGNPALVAQWLGHGDGGILVHKTYNHVREEYAAEQGAKLDFKLNS